MQNVLPQQAGLEVTGILYQYTVEKEREADLLVTVQNENAIDGGYIFRDTQDWSGIPGNTLTRYNPIADIPIQYWGDGSIEKEGEGEVTNAKVVYNYRFQRCFDPQSDPTCPGYIAPYEYEPEEYVAPDPLEDQYVQDELEKKADLEDREQEERERRQVIAKEKVRSILEEALSISDGSILDAQAYAQAQALFSMSIIPNQYNVNIDGGEYNDVLVLDGGVISDNRAARRASMAQEAKHSDMVNMQYKN